MANLALIKDDVTYVTLRGVKLGLIFTLNAYALLEEKYGSVAEAFATFEKEKMVDVRYFLWCGALDEHPDLTEQQVGRLITMGNMNEAMEAATKAIKASQAAEEDEVETSASPNQ